MPIIRPEGLLGGERMAELSDTARMYWPFIYAASNGYGRFEIDYLKIINGAFTHFHQKPSERQVGDVLKEYRDAHLLFIYRADGQIWGAWDSAAGQRYFNAADKRSPAPPEAEFQEWREQYQQNKMSRANRASALGLELIDEEAQHGVSAESAPSERRNDAVSTSNLHNTTPTSTLTLTHKNTNTTQSSEEGGAGGDRTAKSNITAFPVAANRKALADLADWSKPDIQERAKDLGTKLHQDFPAQANLSAVQSAIRDALLGSEDPDAEYELIEKQFYVMLPEWEEINAAKPGAYLVLHEWIRGQSYRQRRKPRLRTRGSLAMAPEFDPFPEV